MRLSFIFFYLFSITRSSNLTIPGADGDAFVDDFSHYDESLWSKDDDYIYCTGSSCEMIREDHLQYTYIDKTDGWKELIIRMTHGCKGSFCCEDGICANYTTGSLTSRHKYGYGSFRFLALAALADHRFQQEGTHDAWSCVSIATKMTSLAYAHTGFGMCVPSQNPWSVMCTAMHGEIQRSEEFALHYNAAKKPSWFRIDWFPDEVSFFIGGHYLTTMKPPDIRVPDIPMHIKISIGPQERVLPSDAPEPTIDDEVEFNMRLFRVRYHKLKEIEYLTNKEELFVMDDSTLSTFTILSFAGIGCIISIGIYWMWNWWEKRRVKYNGGFYTLLEGKGADIKANA